MKTEYSSLTRIRPTRQVFPAALTMKCEDFAMLWDTYETKFYPSHELTFFVVRRPTVLSRHDEAHEERDL